MARMHSRAKGKAGSKKPEKKVKPVWLNYTPEEIEKIIIKLHKEEKSPSEIGMILRDSYGIPDVKMLLKKTINDVLRNNKLSPEIPEDLQALIKKQIMILKHLEKNKKDMPSKRGLQLTESKIFRLSKYYKRTKRIPKNWKFDRETAQLLAG